MKHCIQQLLMVILPVATLVAADQGFVKARGKPGDAGIFVDGKYIGPASRFTVPEKYSVEAGSHDVAIRDPRYEEFTAKITVTPGKTTKISYHPKRLPEPKGPFGRLRLGGGEGESFISVTQGDTGAVYLNKKFVGYVDELNNMGSGIQAPAGDYELYISSPLFGEIRQMVKLEANKVTVIPLPKK